MTRQQENLTDWQPATGPESVTLTGQWVTLEPLTAAQHASSLWTSIQGHDQVWTWLSDGPYKSEANLTEALAKKEEGKEARFYAILPKNSEAKGYASLMRIDQSNGVIEVGNILFSPTLQRTAAATECLYLLAKYIFEDLGYRRFEWKCNALNLPSRRAAERFGFTFEGIFRQHMRIKGQNRDTAWFSMLDSEWPQRKQAFETWLSPDNFDPQGRQKKSLLQRAANLNPGTSSKAQLRPGNHP